MAHEDGEIFFGSDPALPSMIIVQNVADFICLRWFWIWRPISLTVYSAFVELFPEHHVVCSKCPLLTLGPVLFGVVLQSNLKDCLPGLSPQRVTK